MRCEEFANGKCGPVFREARVGGLERGYEVVVLGGEGGEGVRVRVGSDGELGGV